MKRIKRKFYRSYNGECMKKIVKGIIGILSLLLMLAANDIQSEASGEKTNFGSENYEWVLDEPSLIGIYVSSEQLITYSEVYVNYDTEMLEYISGGEMTEPGTIRVTAGDGTMQEYSTMLEFVPRMSGSTQISIQNADIQTDMGETVSLGEVHVPVSIVIPDDCRLSGIELNGSAIVGFDRELTTYTIEVDGSVENAVVNAIAENPAAQIEITDTSLIVGNNTVKVYVTNETGNRARFVLNIVRKEIPAEEQALKKVEEPKEKKDSEVQVVIQKEDSSKADRVHMILLAAAVILGVFLIGLVFIEVKIIKRKIRTKKEGSNSFEKKKKSVEYQKKVSVEADDYLESDDIENLDELEEPEDFDNLEDLGLVDNREIEIEVKHVTMQFKRERDEATSIKEMLIRTAKGERSYEKFKALDDVSFTVKKGEVVGIIGTNGSGKSTILKVISGVLKPTSGTVEVDQSKIQLLTLGTGFDFELTGRENVYLNGAVIGYTKEYIDEKYEEIVKFAELEGFMEEKVRNYSSGMVSRLGFAIATIRDTPEILILDEVLSVGDMFFRKKSNERIKQMMKSGSTVLIVSHSTSVIRENCTKAVWIEKGVLKAIGRPEDVCRAYEKMNG